MVPKPIKRKVRMVLLSDDQIDHIVGNWRRYLWGGLVVMLFPLMLPRGWAIGVFSGFMLFSMGIYGLSFRKWRFDSGLWMLAAFLTLTLGPCWAYFEYVNYHNVLANRPDNVARPMTWDQIRFWTDTVAALFLFSGIVKFAASVAVKNWKRTRPVREI